MAAEQVAAAEVFTGRGGQMRGDNSGGAAIFDVPNIKADPNPYAPLAGQYLANEGRKAIKELELKQKRDKELADLSKLKIDNFWIQYQDEIQKDLDTKSQKLAEIQAQGGDNVRQDLQREQSKYQLEIDGLAKTTEAARERFDAFVKGKELLEKAPVGTYDEEFYAQKKRELDSLINGDGKKSPKEVLDWLNDPNNYPIQAYANFDEIVESRTPEMRKDGRNSYLVRKDVEDSVLQWASGNEEAVKSLDKKYKLNDVGKVVPMIVDEIMRKNPLQRDPTPSGGGGIDINVGGIGGNKKWNIGATSESFDGADYEGQTNTYGLNWAGTGDEPKETYFKDKDGKELLGKPIGFRRKADGTYKVKVAVTTEDQKPMFSTENYDSEAKPKRKEVVEEWVDFSTNKDRLDSMYGGDLKAELDRLRGAKKDFSKIDFSKIATSAAEKLSKGKSSPKQEYDQVIEIDGKKYGVKGKDYYEID